MTTKLELETIKLERFLPRLEEISNGILNHSMLYSNYLFSIVNGNEFYKKYEKERVEIDGLILENLTRISIYLPKELHSLFFEIRKIVSCSWQSTNSINRMIETSSFKRDEIYQLYRDCFNALINRYCKR